MNVAVKADFQGPPLEWTVDVDVPYKMIQRPMTCHSTRVARVESRVFDLQGGGVLREARGE